MIAIKVMLIIGLVALPLLAQHQPDTQKNPFAGDPRAVRAGREIYAQSCESCHGSEGNGGRAPALNTGKFKRAPSDGQLFDTVSNGIPAAGMPASGLKTEEVWRVITYIRSLNEDEMELLPGDVSLGEKLFAGKGSCFSCHEVNGQGGRLGPDLSSIGTRKASSLRDAILKPGGSSGYLSELVTIRTKDGRTVRGLRRNEDTFSIQIADMAGELRVFRKADLTELKNEDKSLMPGDYGRKLSDSEVDDLVAYLKSLRVRDLGRTATAPIGGGLSFERIRDSHKEPRNWLTYWGDYQGRHYSALKQITPLNVSGLQARWIHQPGGGGQLQSTPLVVDGIMYTTGASGYAYALDAASGLQIWEYKHKKKREHDPQGNANRGFALLGGRLFMVTGDAYVIALEAKTGRLLWETEMADSTRGYTATMAPLALKDRVIAGISGGENGIRGFVDAYDPATGRRLWRFYTVPGAGEFGNDTWEGDSWQQGGGATWMTGTYDPALDLLYWGVGNPSPDLNGDVRKGDNLFTCAVVALEASTGKRRWHFQFTPHDTRDWDANETPMLVDRLWKGRQRKLLLQANRNAFFYVLDRESGEFLAGAPFARQTWASGLDKKGRPIVLPDAEPTPEGRLVYPNLAGATNWQAPSYDPATGWFYFTYREAGNIYVKEPQEYVAGKSYWGGKVLPPGEREWGGVKAIDPANGATRWDYKLHSGTYSAGTLATGGGVLFAASKEGSLLAFDSRTGRLLWRTNTGAEIHASPISYEAHGRQYVAIAAGSVLLSFSLPER